MLGVPFIDRWLSSTFKPKTFDDAVDRLSYVTTATLLTFFSIMVSCKQYVGSAIQCWMPMEFKGGWEQYAEDYCFIQNTFFIPEREEIPGDVSERQKAEIGYYQWVPIVLAIQAFMFYLPSWLWSSLYKQCGLDFPSVINEAEALRTNDSESRRKGIHKLVVFIEDILATREKNDYGRFYCYRFGTHLGSWTSVFYVLIKVLYCVNVVGQFIILNKFIGHENFFWGITTFYDLVQGREWQDSGVFPRVTMCDFSVRKLANVHRYTVQCVLMINMFNEKIYLFIWFWFAFVLLATLINTICTIYRLGISKARIHYVRTLLSGPEHNFKDESSKEPIKKFTNYALKSDGVLLMRFIDDHAGAMITKEICENLFTNYLESTPYHHPSHMHGHSTKSATPGMEGPHESLYTPEKVGLMAPDYPIKNV
ncbi:unnamed protein product [Caenorhabditis bovis]|uniref:Innexin n=1 Tax=Caenorhabditis bovis TaxID=2654633 RepID=A0A8S1E977_9PELO|nr:unnamed protein product [Caenorhabditis bovis]